MAFHQLLKPPGNMGQRCAKRAQRGTFATANLSSADEGACAPEFAVEIFCDTSVIIRVIQVKYFLSGWIATFIKF
jgi:hypothetical protein